MTPLLFFLSYVVAIWLVVAANTSLLPRSVRIVLFAASASIALFAFAAALALLGVKK